VQVASRASRVFQVTPGSLVHKDQWENVAHLVHQVRMVSQDRLVSLELMEQMELLDQMDNLGLPVQLDLQDSEARRVTLVDRVPRVSLGKSVHVVLLDHQDSLAKSVHLANRDLKELQVQQAFQDHEVHLDRED